ncbi:MAG: histidine kinase [Synergistaceae bacterium]|jgi:signal transduction histidine kinase|nr:histidine kinase [Synergistaceae bacterium]
MSARKLPRSALFFLMLAVTAFTAVTFLISLYVFKAQAVLTDRVLSSYVTDVAETFAQGLPQPPDIPPVPATRGVKEFGSRHTPRRRMFFRMFATDPSLNSGGLLLFDSERRPLGGSEGAENLISLWRDDVALGEPTVVSDKDGRSYYMVVRALDQGGYVLVAASKTNLLSSYSRLWNFWLISVMISSAAMLVGIAALWRYFVLPIRRIVEAVGSLRWGVSMPKFAYEGLLSLYEVCELESVIERSASEAISEKGLRARYVTDIVQAQEDARRRLARELHDGPLQSVVASIKRIQLALSSAVGGAAREKLDEAERISQYAANEIRDYCDELSPSWTALGISSALEELSERLSMAHNALINVSVDDEYGDMPGDCALAIIRILQEAVSNSVRHGGAHVIDVRLERAGDDLIFSITDDGRGFSEGDFIQPDFERTRLLGHRGLSNMHERVQMLGGTLSIGPASDNPDARGARISVTIPISLAERPPTPPLPRQ